MLYRVRSLMKPLQEAPYGYSPDDHRIVAAIHGTEIVAVAKRNGERCKEAVDRMPDYAELGVAFKVCGQVMKDYGYAAGDFPDVNELAHWQRQRYALIVPQTPDKANDIESIR